MIPVRQEFTTPPKGDCVRACIASVLELPLRDVPNLITEERWYDAFGRWLNTLNLYWITFPIEPGRARYHPPGYAIMGCRPRGADWTHAVVVKDGEVVWNPHPGYGPHVDVGEWTDWTIIAPLDPAKPSGKMLLYGERPRA